MENLSLIIRSRSEQIYNYINELEPLINDFNTEIIILNNELEKLNIPYKHVVYKYEESYEKLQDFYSSVCTNENNILIEEGMILNREIVEKIKNKLLSCIANIFCNVKRFLSKDKKSFSFERLLIINNSKSNNEEYLDLTIEDTSLLLNTFDSIEKGITLLSRNNDFDKLYTWYSEFLIDNNPNSLVFFELLEKTKLLLNPDEVETIERAFLNSKKDDKYTRYLEIKNKVRNEKLFDRASIVNEIKGLGLNTDDKYFCYFLLEVIKNNSKTTELFQAINFKVLQEFLNYLFDITEDFHLLIYNYLISINISEEISINNNTNIKLYLDICKCYIKNMSDRSENFENKQKLVQVFTDYTNYGFYLISQLKMHGKNIITNPEIKFLQQIDEVIKMINKNKIEVAIGILKNTSKNYPIMNRPVEYYIQRLRFENKNYPYKISICMIVKNEEKNIDRCLESLKPLIKMGLAEYIIVDTGSTDKTVEIAQKYVEKIYFHEWQGSFSEARNYSISLAQGEYIFIMDADEEIESMELKKIVDALNSTDYCNYNTFSFKIKNFSDEKYKKFSIFTQNLIFKNDGSFYYSGSVHNQPVCKLPVKHLDCTILHYGYIMTADIKDKKFNRTATLLKKELEKNPTNIYYRFQLSVSYSMHGDLQESLEQVKIYMKILREKYQDVKGNLMYYNNAALVYSNNMLFDEAIEICDDALAVQPDFIDFIYYKGYGLFEKKEYRKAIIYLKEYLDLIDDFPNHDVMHDDKYLFYTLDSKEIANSMLAVSYNKTSQYDNCIKQVFSIKDIKIFKNSIYVVVNSYLKQGKYNELAHFYETQIYNNSDNEIAEVFKYFLEGYLLNISEDKQNECIIAFAKSNVADEYIDIFRFRAGGSISQNVQRVLSFIDKYDINEADSVSGNMIIDTMLPIVKEYKYDSSIDIIGLKNLKRCSEFILHRCLNLKQYEGLSRQEIMQILDKYINICTYFISIGKEEMLEENEILFISKILNALEELKNNNLIRCITFIRDSVFVHKKMAKAMELFLETIIPGYRVDEHNNTTKSIEKKLKNQISELINTGDIQEALIKINELENIPSYDQETYSLKAVALIMANLYNEAEDVLQKGLDLYPSSTDLLLNYSYLKGLMNNEKKAVELYCYAKMINFDSSVEIKEILPYYKPKRSMPLNVLSGTIEIANQMNTITMGLRDLGVNARNLNYYQSYLNYESDLFLDINKFKNFNDANLYTKEYISKLIYDYDIFHFQFGTSLALDNSDLPVLKELSKKIVMQHHGSDIRMLSIAKSFNPYVKVKDIDEDGIKRKLSKLSKYVDNCVVGDYELYEYVKDYYPKIDIVPIMIDIDKFNAMYNIYKNKHDFTIVHAPTSPEYKGTKYIIKAVEELKISYPYINFKLIHGIPHEEAIKIYQDADIIIDQILTGSYGVFAIESMAMGKPVICWISDYMKEKYSSDLPIISANPDTIKNTLEIMLQNRDMLKEIGVKSRKYVEKYHNINTICKKLLTIYNK